MSDRCFLKITIRQQDQAAMERLIGQFDDVDHEDERSIKGDFNDAPYAYADELHQLASEGAVFEGYHEACIGAWDAHAFVGVDGTYLEALYAPASDTVVVPLNERGRPFAKSFADAQAFSKARRKVKALLNGTKAA